VTVLPDATFAYQGGGRGFDLEMLHFMERRVQAASALEGSLVRQPDLTLWFDLAPDIAAARLSGARLPDKFESQPLEFFNKVADGYLQRYHRDPGRIVRIEANDERDAVWQAVLGVVTHRGWLT